MAGIIARINTSKNIGRVTLNEGPKASIISPNFAPKPNVALAELNDVTVTNLENGSVISFNTALNKYEAKLIDANNIALTSITGGTF